MKYMQIIFFKSQYLNNFEIYIETFSSQNAPLNRKQKILLVVIILVVVSGTKSLNYFLN